MQNDLQIIFADSLAGAQSLIGPRTCGTACALQGPTFNMLSEGAVGREGGHAAHSPVERGLEACEGRGSQGEGLHLTWVIKQTPYRQRCTARTTTCFVRSTPLILSGRQEGGACCDRGNMRAWHLAVLHLLPARQPQVTPCPTCIAEGDQSVVSMYPSQRQGSCTKRCSTMHVHTDAMPATNSGLQDCA